MLGDAPQIAARVSALRPTAVNSILAEVRLAQASGRSVVSLMRGEPDFRTPGHIVDAAVEALRRGRTNYPDNRGEIGLRESVAQKLVREQGLTYDPGSEILITDGATLGIHAALTALLNPGDEVLLPSPIYDAYQSPIRLAGGVARAIPGRVVDGRFRIDSDSLEKAWTPPARILLLNTPWNPTGTVFNESELAMLAAFVLRRNLVLISDEIYEAITYDDHVHRSAAAISGEVRSRSLIVNSFSKSYAMTGWRLGYCAGPREIIQAMFLVLQQSSRGPATFVQDAGAAALSGPQDCVAEMRNTYASRRATVLDRLSGMNRVRVLRPEGGFFAMVDIRETGQPSHDVQRRLLNDYGVVVAHGSAYGAEGEGTLRVSFASGGANLEAGLDRLRQGLSSL